MLDFYGDGWDGAEVYVETPWDDIYSAAPTCDMNPVTETLCSDTSGLFPMVLSHQNSSYTPRNYWEAYWKVTAVGCNTTGVYYTGGFNTTMIWDYDADGDEWSLVYWENLWPNEKECDACGDAKACKPKPKKKSKKKSKKSSKKNSKKGPMKGDTTSTSTTNTTSTSSTTNTTNTGKSKPRYGPPAVNVRVTMWDEEGDGWWRNDYHGASWYLADDTRTELFYTGTLCDGDSGFCNLCLGDGSYTMRFSGDADDFTAWDFCGITGGYAHELTFHVKKGKCIPDSLVSLETDCFGTVTSTVTLTGIIALGGFNSEIFNSADSAIVSQVLADFVNGWNADDLSVVSTALDTRELATSDRRLSEFTFDVSFEVSFVAETTYGVDGRDFRKVENLISSLEDKLDSRLSSSNFVSALNGAARLSGASTLSQVRAAELVSLELESIVYEGVEAMQESTLPSYEDTNYWGKTSVHASKYNYTTLSLFFGGLAVAFFAFVGILSHSMNGYKPVSDDSQHPTVYSVPEVMPSEMDESVGGPAQRHLASADTRSSL
eukprot:CAMPEP_0185024456 /NCGR_PEP_ID=MMETSP1103-20130426/7532_1 /TAXON_ID=36769 /ORGANISM="Paraphysomonas bandaiensis, Strain Caron Lab Isolate" /LENGTH=545 /DNA_ID=CAMNT_0027557429 /DNA_START=160 /DNA_END=1797 /DNA_ORIENTATION=+